MTRLTPIVWLLGAVFAASLAAQEPEPKSEPGDDASAPAIAEDAPAEPAPRPRRRGGRRPTVVVEAGTVHPVSGPAITDGVVVIRGQRIVAVGKRGEVEVPDNATVRSFPTGHVYPGLVDAATDAFTDAAVRNDGALDASDALIDVLARRHDREDELARAGITTAYVTVPTAALVRGQGAIVRPVRDGFEPWQGRERAAVGLRLTDGPSSNHALQRQATQQAADGLFEGLDEFREAQEKHEEALEKYAKEFEEYLAWHRKKNGKGEANASDGDGTAETAPDAAAPATDGDGAPPPREGGRRGRRGGPPRDGAPGDGASERELAAAVDTLFAWLLQDPQQPPSADPDVHSQDPKSQDPKSQEPKQDPAPAKGAAEAGGDKAKQDEGPKRPTWPKAPPANPQKQALLRVVDGELPLRVEAHRPDELRAALRLFDEREIPVMVLERAFGAADLGDALAARGIAVVLTDVLPASLPQPYEDFDPLALPAALQDAGVPFAIASGTARRSATLRLMAAAAVGGGLPPEAALRAITLTPAEILGVGADTGSLTAGKFGDLIVCDRPLFDSDSRVLLVLGKGRPEYEAD